MLLLAPFLPAQDNAAGHLERARSLRSEGILFDGLRAYEAYLELRPDDAEVRLEYAGLQRDLGLHLDAAMSAARVLQIEPGNESARELMRREIAAWENPENGEPPREEELLMVAQVFRASGDHDQAETYFRRYLENEPTNLEARHQLAQMLYDNGRTEDAFVAMREIGTIDPSATEYRLKLARWLSYEDGRLLEAIAELEAITADFPGTEGAYTLLGNFYRFNGEPEKAKTAYRKALRQNPADDEAIDGYLEAQLVSRPLFKAQAARGEGDLDRAAAYYEMHFEEMRATRERLQRLEERRDRLRPDEYERASGLFRRYLERSPSDAQVRKEYASLMAEAGNNREAVRQMRLVLEEAPQDREARLILAEYLTYEEDSLSEAGSVLDQMLAENPNDVEAQARRGEVYFYQGDVQEARQAFRQASELDPNLLDAREGLDKIRNLYRPQAFARLGGTYDWSADYALWWFGLRGETVIFRDSSYPLQIGAFAGLFFYSQEQSKINPAVKNFTDSVDGQRLQLDLAGNLSLRWQYFADLIFARYDRVSDAVLGDIGLGYVGEKVSGRFGFRRQEAVTEHYNLNTLLEEIRTNDIFAEVIYRTNAEKWYRRWQLEGFAEAGRFTDDNERLRVILRALNVGIETPKRQLKYGVALRHQAYKKDSPFYFSPDDYTGLGPIFRYDYRADAYFSFGATGTAYYIFQVDEWDLAAGGYIGRQLTESSRLYVRVDYGESTLDDDEIRAISGLVELQYVF